VRPEPKRNYSFHKKSVAGSRYVDEKIEKIAFSYRIRINITVLSFATDYRRPGNRLCQRRFGGNAHSVAYGMFEKFWSRAMIKILFVNLEGRIGGAERSLLLLLIECLRGHFAISVACPSGSQLAAKLETMNVETHGVAGPVNRSRMSGCLFTVLHDC